MRHQLRTAVILAAASVAFTACANDTTPPPTAPAKASIPSSPTADLAVPACDIPTVKGFARDYAKSNRDPLNTIISELQKVAPNTDIAFDALARVAAIRGTGAQATGVTGATFDGLVRGLLGCAQSSVLTGTETLDGGFGPAIDPAAGWLFEVRGKTGAGASDDPPGYAYQRGSASPATWWAVGPSVTTPPAATQWFRSFGSTGTQAKRVLIYGYPDPTFLPNLSGVQSRFEIRTIPKISSTFETTVKIGLCYANLPPAAVTQRLNHNKVFVPQTALVCGDGPPAINVASSGFGAVSPFFLAQRAIEFFGPRPAFAAFVGGAIGGTVRDLSPSAVYDLSALDTLQNLGVIDDGKVSVALHTTPATSLPSPYLNHVVVRVMTKATPAPVEGVPVEMSIAGNSSSVAFFNVGTGPDVVTVTRTTDSDGFADFGGVFLTKSGGYQLNFRVAFDGVFGQLKLSNSFNYQNK